MVGRFASAVVTRSGHVAFKKSNNSGGGFPFAGSLDRSTDGLFAVPEPMIPEHVLVLILITSAILHYISNILRQLHRRNCIVGLS
jgi:hypothetical protein